MLKIAMGLALGLFSLVLASCVGEGSSSGDAEIPQVDIACNQASATDCASAGASKTVYVGLISNLALVCSSYMDGITAASFASQFDTSGTGTTFKDGSFMVGSVVNWVDSQGIELNTIQKTTYRACAFIDTDGNGQLDSNEPVGEDDIAVSSDTSTADLDDFWEDK